MESEIQVQIQDDAVCVSLFLLSFFIIQGD